MTPLEQIAPAFIDMAHSIVWASVATVDENSRPRTRILHPIWEWDGTDLFGWIATVPSPVKKAHLAVHPEMAVSYWTTTHDTCSAECLVEWYHDDETRAAVWNSSRPVPNRSAMTRPSSRCGTTVRRPISSPCCDSARIGSG